MNFAEVIKKLLPSRNPDGGQCKDNQAEAVSEPIGEENAAEAAVKSDTEPLIESTDTIQSNIAEANADVPDESVENSEAAQTADPDYDMFTESVELLSADDIAPEPEKKKLTGAELASEVTRKLVLLACTGIFIWSAGTLVRSFVDYRRGEELYSGVADSIFNTDLSGHKVALSQQTRPSMSIADYTTRMSKDYVEIDQDFLYESYNVKFEQMKSNLTYLQTLNPDIFGYIHIEGTNISYPVVLGVDNEYYLDHAYTGDYMVCGSIFADFTNYTNMDWNYNTVLYGHNMNNGTMFNNVTMFLEEDVFNSKQVELYTFDGIYTFEPFAIYRAHETYHYFNTYFTSESEFVDFCYEMQTNSNFNKNLDFEEGDRILTLSTCFNDLRTVYRYTLQSKLVKVEK